MKKVLKIIGIVLGAIFALLIICFVAIMLYLNHEAPIEQRPLGEYTSPDGKHVCSVHVSDGGATTPWTVVAQVRGTWIIGKRTIYAVDAIDEAVVIWRDDRTVWINGVALDIFRDHYVSEVGRRFTP